LVFGQQITVILRCALTEFHERFLALKGRGFLWILHCRSGQRLQNIFIELLNLRLKLWNDIGDLEAALMVRLLNNCVSTGPCIPG
jgi:hypothetical protein